MTAVPESLSTPWKRFRDVLVNALGQVRTVEKIYPGIMHLMIFWGVIIQIIGTAIKMMQMGLFVPFTWPLFSRPVYLGYELIMDLAGAAIILGVAMAVVRRTVIKPSYLETSWDDVYVLVLLFLLPSVGFITESFRLLSFDPDWSNWSPIGAVLAAGLERIPLPAQTATAVHPYLFWTHVGLGLLFAGSIPFTKLRHLFATPIHIFFKTGRDAGELELIPDLMGADVLGAGKVEDFSSRDLLAFDACLQCGRCEEVCPPTIAGMVYSPRVLLLRLREELAQNLLIGTGQPPDELAPDLRTEDMLWACTTCGACLDACPAFIRPPEHVVDIRRSQVLMTGDMPGLIGETLRNFERQGNPWGMGGKSREAWTEGLDVRVLSPGDEVDVLFFVGCAGALDDRNQEVTRSFARLLNKLDVDFSILGDRELCCGESARRMGNEYLFQTFAQENIALFEEINFQRIITLCPHGLNTLRQEYPALGGEFTVLHASEFLFDALSSLDPESGGMLDQWGTLTFHDSCYLGRYQQIYREPRSVLRNAGLQLTEMSASGDDSLCCGGGGGAMWLETDPETRVNRKRLEQAQEIKADTVATACPYCLIMLDDAVRSQGLGEEIQVLDLVEILDQASGSKDNPDSSLP